MDIKDSSSSSLYGGTVSPEMPKDPPAVLQIVPELDSGGVERGTIDIAGALVRAGFRSYVASAGGRLVHELKRVGATHVALPLHSKNPLVMMLNIRRVGELIDRFAIDIVHARSRAPAWSSYLATRRRQCTFLTTFHGAYNSSNALKTWYNSIMTRGHRVIAISNFIDGHIRTNYGIDGGKIALIPRGIDTKVFNPAAVSAERMAKLAANWRLSDDVPTVIMPGRLTRWKGQAVLIEAMAMLRQKDVRCVIVGDDQGRTKYRRELETLVRQRSLEQTVRVMEHCNDMPAAYMLADVVVSASTDPEAFGRVAAEGQAMGRPVVTTDHGASKEPVMQGTTGWLVPPGDPPALARTLDHALGFTEAERQEIAVVARHHIVENFSVRNMCSQTIDLYNEYLQVR